MKHFITALLLAGTLGVRTTAAERWDLPIAYVDDNYQSQTAKEFAKCITLGTAGELDIVVHPAGSLIKGSEAKRAIQTGLVQLGSFGLSVHRNEEPLFSVNAIPFLTTSFEDAEKLWAIAQPTIKTLLTDKNLKLLYSVPWPPQGMYFKKEVFTLDDIKGIRSRSYDITTARLIELSGMIPTQIELSDLSQALATGVVESFIGSGSNGYYRKLWGFLSHYYEIDAWIPRDYIMMNKGIWEGLDREKQKVIHSCSATASQTGLQRAIYETQHTIDGLRENGMSILEASPELMKELKRTGEIIKDEWLIETGEQGQIIIDTYDAYRAAKYSTGVVQ